MNKLDNVCVVADPEDAAYERRRQTNKKIIGDAFLYAICACDEVFDDYIARSGMTKWQLLDVMCDVDDYTDPTFTCARKEYYREHPNLDREFAEEYVRVCHSYYCIHHKKGGHKEFKRYLQCTFEF